MNSDWANELLEDDIKRILVQELERDFFVQAEVEGIFLVDSTSVRMDYILLPREHLKQMGFTAQYVGLEVKSPVGKDNTKRGLDVCWQAVTYSQSLFRLNGDSVRPDFVLIFPPLKAFLGEEGRWIYVSSLIVRANIGMLEVDINKHAWQMVFHAARYFHSERGPGPHKPAAVKRRVGTRR